MAEDRSHNASHESRQADERGGARDADLEALFKSWSAEAEPEAPRAQTGVRLRLAITTLVVIFAGTIFYQTREDFAWWLEPSEPRVVGDVRELYREGKPLPALAPNTHVKVSGLVPTRLRFVKLEGLSDGPRPDQATEYIFYCPLTNALVVTAQPIVLPTERLVTVDPTFESLLSERLVYPEDLAVEVSVNGRLRQAAAAPRALAPFVDYLVGRLELDPTTMWVLEDDKRPSDASWVAIIWGLSGLSVGLSFFFLIRAIRARRIVPSA